jgi:hypothetical protein
MLLRIVIGFLLFMIVMGAVQKWLNPKHRTPLDRLRSAKLPKPRKCKTCGRFLLGRDDCTCKDH